MARKEQITKQMILDGAFDLVRTQGIEMLTARKLASHISCSTQPIFRVYTNMEELSNEVFVKAKAFYEQFCLDFEQTNDTPFVDLGLCYISFAKKPQSKGFLNACEMMGLYPENVLVIGNDVICDIYGGSKCGMITAIVDSVCDEKEDYR